MLILCNNSVKTKVGKQFFNLIKMHFLTDSKLSKVFNKKTIKMSYSYLPNIKNFVNSHKQKILKAKYLSPKDYKCRNLNNFPFNGHCLSKGIYKATVYWYKGNKEYVGSTGVSFKTRYNQHKFSLNNDKGHQTMLSKFYKSNRNSITGKQWWVVYFIQSKINIFLKKVMIVQYVISSEWLLLKWTGKNH